MSVTIQLAAAPSSVRSQPVQSLRESKGFGIKSPLLTPATPESRARSRERSDFSSLPYEGEDAQLTGLTRSLKRRLLALNVPGTLRGSL